jgi:HlyD family secretion protein
MSSHFHDPFFTPASYTCEELEGQLLKGFPPLIANPKKFIVKINGKTAWTITLLIILIAAGWYYFFKVRTVAQIPNNPAQAQTAVARRGDLVLSATGTGTLIAQTQATFGFKTSGQVTQVNVKIGDRVEVGQVLAQLDDTLVKMKYAEAQQAVQELYSAASIANIEQEIATGQDSEASARAWLGYLLSPGVVDAEENLSNAEQKLADAKTEAQNSPSDSANQTVKEKEAAVTYLKEKLDQAQTYYKNVYAPETFTEYRTEGQGRSRRQVVVTYTDPSTGEELPKIDWPSTADIATARNNYVQAIQTIKDGETFLESVRTGNIPEDATGAGLNNITNAELALKNAQTELDNTSLTAPVTGTVIAMDLQVGEQGNTSSAITISQLNQPYALDIYLNETDWLTAKVGNKVNITFDLLPRKTFPGTVTVVYPELNSSSDSPLVHILAQLNQNISQNLPSGTGATVEVVGGEANNAVLVPANAIQKTNSGGYEVSVIQNGQTIKQSIEIGLQGTTYVEIKSGLDAGAVVVTK